MSYRWHPVWDILHSLHDMNEVGLGIVLAGLQDMVEKEQGPSFTLGWMVRLREVVYDLLEGSKNDNI